MAAVFFLGTGCESPSVNSKEPQTLRLGMTKKQVTALYGPGDEIRSNPDGELWIYYLNVGKQLVPWNLGHTPELRLIHFDAAGKVSSWRHTK